MAANSMLRYRKFEECNGRDEFLTKENQGKLCWKMATEVGDFRSAFNICEDCIVFLLNNGTLILSELDIHSIRNREVRCKFFNI